MNVLEIKNLRKAYGKKIAVDGVSFAVEEGEIFGLLGPNGAGKTTTMEILEGLKSADEGKIKIVPKSEMGVVLQTTGFLPELTLRELLELMVSFYPKSRDLKELAEEFDLAPLLSRRYSELSGGQKQRFALAAALAHEPRLLILDEPTVGLDPAVRQKFWETILNLRKQGITILLTTHYMEEAEIVCDRVAIIDNGKILAIEKPIKLINSLGIVSRIKFMSSKPLKLGELESLPGILSVRRERYTYDLETETPEESLRELLEWEKKFSGKIFNLQVQQATLDDVFLKLTGHNLRE